MSRSKDIKPDSDEPRDRLPLYPEIGFRHKFTEMIDAPTNAHRFRVADRSVLAQGHMGTPQEQQACTRDAQRLCRKQLGDDNAVQQCLQQNRTKLSKSCQKVFQSHGM